MRSNVFFSEFLSKLTKEERGNTLNLPLKFIHFLISHAQRIVPQELENLTKINRTLYKKSNDNQFDQYYTTLSPIEVLRSKEGKGKEKLIEDVIRIEKESYFYFILNGKDLGEVDEERRNALFKICFCYFRPLNEEEGKKAAHLDLKILAKTLKDEKNKRKYFRDDNNYSIRSTPLFSFYHSDNKNLLVNIIFANLKNIPFNYQTFLIESIQSKNLKNLFLENQKKIEKIQEEAKKKRAQKSKGKQYHHSVQDKAFAEDIYQKLCEEKKLEEYFTIFENYSSSTPDRIISNSRKKSPKIIGNNSTRFTIHRNFTKEKKTFYTYKKNNGTSKDSEILTLIDNKIEITDIFSNKKNYNQYEKKYLSTISDLNISLPAKTQLFSILKTIKLTENKTITGSESREHRDKNKGDPRSIILRTRIAQKSHENIFSIYLAGLEINFENNHGAFIDMLGDIKHGGSNKETSKTINTENTTNFFRTLNLSKEDIEILNGNIEYLPTVLVTAIYSSKNKTHHKISINKKPELRKPEILKNDLQQKLESIKLPEIKINLKKIENHDIQALLRKINKNEKTTNEEILNLFFKLNFLLTALYNSIKKEKNEIILQEDKGYVACLHYCHNLCDEINKKLSTLGWSITFNLATKNFNNRLPTHQKPIYFSNFFNHLIDCFNYIQNQITLKTKENESLLEKIAQICDKKKKIEKAPKNDSKINALKKNNINLGTLLENFINKKKASELIDSNQIATLLTSMNEVETSYKKYSSEKSRQDIKLEIEVSYNLAQCSFYIANHYLQKNEQKTDNSSGTYFCQQAIDFFEKTKLAYKKQPSIEINDFPWITLTRYNQGASEEILADYYFDLAEKQEDQSKAIEYFEKAKKYYHSAGNHYIHSFLKLKYCLNQYNKQKEKDCLLELIFEHRVLLFSNDLNDSMSDSEDNHLDDAISDSQDDDLDDLTKQNFISKAIYGIKKSLEYCDGLMLELKAISTSKKYLREEEHSQKDKRNTFSQNLFPSKKRILTVIESEQKIKNMKI